MNIASIAVTERRRAMGLDDERKESALDQRGAMDRFLARIERRAFRMAQIAVQDSDDAMDIVQDAMIRLVRRYANRPDNEWTPLFFRILRNRITDHQRRQSVTRRVMAWFVRDSDSSPASDPVASAPAGLADRPDRQVAMADAMARLEVAVAALPGRQQEAFLLRAMEGLDVAATASAMGCSEGSVKTHYSRAVRSLRSALGEHWP